MNKEEEEFFILVTWKYFNQTEKRNLLFENLDDSLSALNYRITSCCFKVLFQLNIFQVWLHLAYLLLSLVASCFILVAIVGRKLLSQLVLLVPVRSLFVFIVVSHLCVYLCLYFSLIKSYLFAFWASGEHSWQHKRNFSVCLKYNTLIMYITNTAVIFSAVILVSRHGWSQEFSPLCLDNKTQQRCAAAVIRPSPAAWESLDHQELRLRPQQAQRRCDSGPAGCLGPPALWSSYASGSQPGQPSLRRCNPPSGPGSWCTWGGGGS